MFFQENGGPEGLISGSPSIFIGDFAFTTMNLAGMPLKKMATRGSGKVNDG